MKKHSVKYLTNINFLKVITEQYMNMFITVSQ
jgi:hypothetical protein